MSEVKGIPGLTKKSLIVGIIGVILVSAWLNLEHLNGILCDIGTTPPLAYDHNFIHFRGNFQNAFGVATIAIMLLALVNQVKRVFSMQEVAVITVMILVSGAFVQASDDWNLTFWVQFVELPAFAGNKAWWTTTDLEKWSKYAPSLWFGDWEYNARLAGAVYDINWIKIAPNIIWSSLFILSIFFTMIFFLLNFRRLWVDVEGLTFPMGNIAAGMVTLTQPKSPRVKMFASRWFAFGFLLQFIWHFIMYAIVMIPAYPGIWGKLSGGVIPGTKIPAYPIFDLSSLTYPLGIWTALQFYLDPWAIGWTGLLSMDVLVGIVVGWLVFNFLYPAALSSVWGPRVTPGSVATGPAVSRLRGFEYVRGVSVNQTAFELGMVIGLAVWPLIQNRKTMVPILKGLIKEPAEAVDPDRPLPYRITWLGFIISFVLAIASAAMIYVHIPTFVLWLVLFIIILLGLTRAYGESGGAAGSWHVNPLWMSPAIATFGFAWMAFGSSLLVGGYNQTNISTIMILFQVLQRSGIPGIAFLCALTLDQDKIAKATNTSKKSMFKAFSIAVVLTVVASSIFKWIWVHILPWGLYKVETWQITRLPPENIGTVYRSIDEGQLLGPLGAGTVPRMMIDTINTYPVDWAVKIIIGLAIAITIPLLRTRFAWLRISVAGILLGSFLGFYYWAPALVSLIIKYLLIRVGGVKLFEEKFTPFAVGAIMGFALDYFIWTAFYVPYVDLTTNLKLIAGG